MDILTETQNLWERFQRGGAFRVYLSHRLRLVLPALVIFLAYSVAVTAGTVITLGGTRSFLVLVGLLSAPVILISNLYILVFVFLLWVENRAIAHATHHVPRTAKEDVLVTHKSVGAVVKQFPLWAQAAGAALLAVPLVFLWQLTPWTAFLMLLLVLAVPAGYAALDR
jgi:type IV secretory pathway TrbD component